MNTEKNKLFIEFIGIEKESDGTPYINLGADSFYFDLYDEDSCKFHTSWDWLIPVVERCKDLQLFGSQRLISNIDESLIKLDLMAVHSNVVEFINYYNHQIENGTN